MRIAVITGAGISAPSGVPVYRGDGGLWTTNPELEKVMHVSTLLTRPD